MTSNSIEDAIADPVLKALQTTQRHLGLHAGAAHKYRADVAPFAFLDTNTAAALEDLASLLPPGEHTYLFGDRPPENSSFVCEGPTGVTQMLFPATAALPAMPPAPALTRLSGADGPAMVTLTDAAFPGFFRARTCEMGDYYGIWEDGRLIAMGGERLIFGVYREVSGICTLAEHRGKGLAVRIIGQILQDHRRDGIVSWLYAVSTNRNAIDLYLRLGFIWVREVQGYRMTRRDGCEIVPELSQPITEA